MKHKREIRRWADRPDGTKVWRKDGDHWTQTTAPEWLPECHYVVDDKHAQLRMEWIDAGMPPLEVMHAGKWESLDGTPLWNLTTEYRIKPWYSGGPTLAWVWHSDPALRKLAIVTGYQDGFVACDQLWRNAKPLTPEEAERYICKC